MEGSLPGRRPLGRSAVSAETTAAEAPCQPVQFKIFDALLLSSLSEILAPTQVHATLDRETLGDSHIYIANNIATVHCLVAHYTLPFL